MTEIIAYLAHFVKKIGAPNFLAIGIVIIVIWLLISGFKKGLKRRGGNQESDGKDPGA
ncbi:MAG TPA: hypothetical protein VLZ03_16340 [Thermodesulfobacteriota bacterium]|nr:hypothetical protein [Thermodesulfobacteriota bacterium]